MGTMMRSFSGIVFTHFDILRSSEDILVWGLENDYPTDQI